ncbi:MAG TPA: ATP-dependent sacrificial sulfur transferase LarE [Candidatus Obscuribacterales bacterium]
MEASTLEAKEQHLVDSLSGLDSLIVAYSGGVDSSLLAAYARRVMGDRARIVIAVSPSLAAEELEAARAQAEKFGWDLIEIHTDEVSRAEYQRNDELRCYYCKSVLFDELGRMATAWGISAVAYGANMDDLRDFRPGHKAARQHKVLSPLQTAGLTKDEIRALARKAGLPSWDRPQAACLSSRFPTFVPVTVENLAKVEGAERFLHGLGFRQVRVRHHGDLARIEVDKKELPRLTADPAMLRSVEQELKKLGYARVEVDPQGYRPGSANAVSVVRASQQLAAVDHENI